jgi:hypothetical protein
MVIQFTKYGAGMKKLVSFARERAAPRAPAAIVGRLA